MTSTTRRGHRLLTYRRTKKCTAHQRRCRCCIDGFSKIAKQYKRHCSGSCEGRLGKSKTSYLQLFFLSRFTTVLGDSLVPDPSYTPSWLYDKKSKSITHVHGMEYTAVSNSWGRSGLSLQGEEVPGGFWRMPRIAAEWRNQ